METKRRFMKAWKIFPLFDFLSIFTHNMSSHAGAFSQNLIQYSDKTKSFVKELIRESGINKHYQRDIERCLHHSAPLPSATNDTLVDERSPSRRSQGLPGSSGGKTPIKWRSKRSKSAIRQIVSETPKDIFVPEPPKYDQASKERCQDLMACEGELPVVNNINKRKKLILDIEDEILYNDPNFRIIELIREIEERINWLTAMEKYGAANEHRTMMLSQIAIRIRDLEFLDGKKSVALKKKHEKTLHLNEQLNKKEENTFF